MRNKKQYTLNLQASVIDYMDRILQEVSGIKCLILDQETTGIVSLIYSQSQILKKDVYLIEKIELQNKTKLQHMKVIYLLRPTQVILSIINKKENQKFLIEELKNNRFSEYYIYFTNTINNLFIEQLAEADKNDIVKQLQEVFMDYYIVQQDLFTLNILSTLSLTRQPWTPKDHQTMLRIIDGVQAVLFSLRKIPMIRYQGSSEFCSHLAQQLSSRLKEEYEQNKSQFQLSNTLLLIIDRREDPVTPLLNQWTYQAMLHELIGIQNNRLDIHLGQKALAQQGAQRQDKESEFVLSTQQDEFFAENEYANFGELAVNIKEFIDRVTKEKKDTVQINSLEDMQRAVDKIPEIRKMNNNLSKHVTLSCEISKLVEERQLLKISKLEQDIVCNESKGEHQKAIFQILEDNSVQKYEKLKLVMLYALRYENCDKIQRMKDGLRDLGVKQNSLNLINYVLDYAGKNKRQGDLFSDKNLLAKASSKLKQAFKDVPNIYTQHQPYILNILEQLYSGKLRDQDFPTTPGNVFRDKPQEIIIFLAGGVTYEESKEIGLINKQPNQPNILLGGTYIHNSRTFLAEISQISQDIQVVAS